MSCYSGTRFATREDRKRNRPALKAEIEAALAARPAAEWVEILSGVGVPAGPVLSVPEILGHAQVAGRGLVQRFEDVPGIGRDIAAVGTGVRVDGAALAVGSPPPELGAHNAEIYGALGYDAAALSALEEEGVI